VKNAGSGKNCYPCLGRGEDWVEKLLWDKSWEQVAERKQGKFQGKTKPRPPKEVIWAVLTLELTLVKLPNGL
jgi:hypothetical protein